MNEQTIAQLVIVFIFYFILHAVVEIVRAIKFLRRKYEEAPLQNFRGRSSRVCRTRSARCNDIR